MGHVSLHHTLWHVVIGILAAAYRFAASMERPCSFPTNYMPEIRGRATCQCVSEAAGLRLRVRVRVRVNPLVPGDKGETNGRQSGDKRETKRRQSSSLSTLSPSAHRRCPDIQTPGGRLNGILHDADASLCMCLTASDSFVGQSNAML